MKVACQTYEDNLVGAMVYLHYSRVDFAATLLVATRNRILERRR